MDQANKFRTWQCDDKDKLKEMARKKFYEYAVHVTPETKVKLMNDWLAVDPFNRYHRELVEHQFMIEMNKLTRDCAIKHRESQKSRLSDFGSPVKGSSTSSAANTSIGTLGMSDNAKTIAEKFAKINRTHEETGADTFTVLVKWLNKKQKEAEARAGEVAESSGPMASQSLTRGTIEKVNEKDVRESIIEWLSNQKRFNHSNQ